MSKQPDVYIVQNQHKWDRENKSWVPKFDFRPAKKFGQIKFVLESDREPFGDTNQLVVDIRQGLWDYSENDFLLLLGNPALIGLCVAIASERGNGHVNLLQWDGREKIYNKISFKL